MPNFKIIFLEKIIKSSLNELKLYDLSCNANKFKHFGEFSDHEQLKNLTGLLTQPGVSKLFSLSLSLSLT